jgi:hypothetical protein
MWVGLVCLASGLRVRHPNASAQAVRVSGGGGVTYSGAWGLTCQIHSHFCVDTYNESSKDKF